MQREPRKTNSGRRLDYSEKLRDAAIKTHVPGKWFFVDVETNEVWDFNYKRAGECGLLEVARAVGRAAKIMPK